MLCTSTPSQVGVRLPMALRMWLELRASEEKVATSTLVRQMIEAEAKRDLARRGGILSDDPPAA